MSFLLRLAEYELRMVICYTSQLNIRTLIARVSNTFIKLRTLTRYEKRETTAITIPIYVPQLHSRIYTQPT